MDDTTYVPPRSSAEEAPSVGLRLSMLAHPARRRWNESIALEPGQTICIGRESALFPGGPLSDSKISRQHLELTLQTGRATVQDLQSSNGTFLNGKPLHRGEAGPGDILRIGDCFFALLPTELAHTSAILGRSTPIVRVREQISKVAIHPTSVLLLGETGTGKDVAAREIHRQSGRGGDYVALNCGAVAENLMESELFGHLKGAFSGATRDKRGLFQQADRGTLFLDEIGETTPAMQVKLLRAIQNREIRPVGATRSQPIDVRLVAATNRDLVEQVNTGEFRVDLYSRISEWVIELPPLRERREDIPLLMSAFLPPTERRTIDPELLDACLQHPWPFNVRELQSLVALVLIEATEQIGLTPQVAEQLAKHRRIRVAGLPESENPEQPGREELVELLCHYKGNIKRVADHVSRHRNQIYRWLKQFEIDPLSFR